MKLLNVETGLEIALKENRAHILCIENPHKNVSLIGDLWKQSHGEEGQWILS